MAWFKEYKPGDPVRLVANVEETNRVHRILDDIKGLGCRIIKPRGANGKGWMIVVDGTSDLDPIPDSAVGTDTGQVPYKPYDIRVAMGVPAGVIAMWSGVDSAIPVGWVLCDGTNGTPDLRGKFILGGASESGPLLERTGDTGGSDTLAHHRITVSEVNALLPPHAHGFPGSLAQSATTVQPGADNIDALAYSSIPGFTDEASFAGGGDTIVLAHKNMAGDTYDKRPPFYVLAFIMKL